MSANPMQRKSRNSFLLGVIVTLLVAGILIAFLFLQLQNVRKEQAAEAAAKVNVYTINQDVKSGQVLTQDMFSLQAINSALVPSSATSVEEVISTWYLQTKDGESFCRDENGLYLNQEDSIIEVYKVTDADIKENSELKKDGYYRFVEGRKENVTIKNQPYEDDEGMFVVDTNEIDEIARVYEETTGSYYSYAVTDNQKGREKVYLEINNVPVIAKIDLKANTVITPEHIMQSDNVMTDDVRKEEYNSIILPTDLMTGDYIDVRLLAPNGQNFIVVSKKQVEIPQYSDGTYVTDSMIINLREDEILSISCAIVEAFGMSGAKLYANKYVEPGMQDSSLPTYTPSAATTALIQSNPNIVEEASEELATRYSEGAKNARNEYLQQEINKGILKETYDTNIQTKMQESTTNSTSTRKKYLESLTGTVEE